MARGRQVEFACVHLRRKIAFKDFLDAFANPELVERLHIGRAVQKENARHELVGVVHFLDRFGAPGLGEILVAPIVEDAIVEPILVDRGEFVSQRPVEEFDDLWIAPHWLLHAFRASDEAALAQQSSRDETR